VGDVIFKRKGGGVESWAGGGVFVKLQFEKSGDSHHV